MGITTLTTLSLTRLTPMTRKEYKKKNPLGVSQELLEECRKWIDEKETFRRSEISEFLSSKGIEAKVAYRVAGVLISERSSGWEKSTIQMKDGMYWVHKP